MDTGEILDHVQRGDFVPPRELAPHLPPDLEAICLKAMGLEPKNRYSSALALGEDIQRWLADQPVTAYSEPLPARLTRWARGHRRAAALALGVGFLVVLILLSL